MAFELPQLPYAYDALEPHIDARTMEIHHGKHHAGYTAKLNAAIEELILRILALRIFLQVTLIITQSETMEAVTTTTTFSGTQCRLTVEVNHQVTLALLSTETLEATMHSKMNSPKLRLLGLALVGLGFVYVKEVGFAYAQLQTKTTR